MTIELNNRPYANYSYIKETYKISADRLKKWREGRGRAKQIKLNYIEINKATYLYDLLDIEALINYTNLYNKI